jgi:undecaprenyl phosphate N,N'-diacetylbacillosamine 1-phosphate transferase
MPKLTGIQHRILHCKSMYKHFFKRFFDFCISLVALIIVSPIIIVVAIWLHFANKGAGAWFIQERPGKDGKIFKVIKFKTMTDERGPDGELLSNAERLTKVGKFVRAASLDELPQLINVVKGDMALIGPRPLLTWFLPLYDETQMRRHEVRPGITGWAQVNGRNTVTYGEKFKYDVWYVDHLTMWLDIKILWMTVMNVLKRKDIGNGLQDEVDDLGWNARKKEAIELFEKNFRNKK